MRAVRSARPAVIADLQVGVPDGGADSSADSQKCWTLPSARDTGDAPYTLEQVFGGGVRELALPLVPMCDWRQRRRWVIEESALPAGADIRFHELTIWER